ncbi:hypothetical protein JCM3765_000509 [Sporobolomyces pararoseus]
MWFKSDPTVTCFYCNNSLPLLQQDSKGKQRQVEGPVSRGTTSEFDCGVCGCSNERDENGQIVSNHAAFYDSALNEESFSRRGTPTRNNFPIPSSTPTRFSTPSPFCRQCLSNQSLQIHLLSSYPSYSSDEDEPEEEADSFPPLPEYRESLERRYPLVCQNCKAGVEEIVRERDYRVKTGILGGRLRETGKKKLDEVQELKKLEMERRKWLLAGVIWRLRFILWLITHLLTIATGLKGLLGGKLTTIAYLPDSLSFSMLLLSPLWTFWDPTWNSLRIERKKKGQIRSRVKYRQLYIILQGIALLFRFATSTIRSFDLFTTYLRHVHFLLLTTASLAFLSPLRIPRLSTPPPILLRSTDSPSRPSTPTTSNTFSASLSSSTFDDPLEPLQNLSLSKRTSILSPPPLSPSRSSATSTSNALSNPKDLRSRLLSLKNQRATAEGGAKFGQASFSTTTRFVEDPSQVAFPENLHQEEPAMQVEASLDDNQDNSMDWTPTEEKTDGAGSSIWFKPRSFVVPDFKAPTGLEGILEKIGLRDQEGGEKMDVDGGNAGEETGVMTSAGSWWKRWLGS